MAPLTMLLMATVPSLLAAADDPPELEHNPFSRPPSEAIASAPARGGAESVTGDPLQLQATMIGSVQRLANVDGRILRRGDEIQGHVLVAIHERYAVFERNGKRTTVYVKPLQADNDE